MLVSMSQDFKMKALSLIQPCLKCNIISVHYQCYRQKRFSLSQNELYIASNLLKVVLTSFYVMDIDILYSIGR